MTVVLPLLIIAMLILLNAVFVAAEFALVGVPRASVDSMAREGRWAARIVSRILHNPRRQDRYVATAQLGITAASLGLGMYGEHELAALIASWLEPAGLAGWVGVHTLASVLAVLFLTYFHIVLGEMLPKSLALLYPQRSALTIVPPMVMLYRLLYPLVLLLNGIGTGVLRLLGVKRGITHDHFCTPEELQFIVDESLERGLIRPESARVVRELLDFGELTAGEGIVPRVEVVGIPVDASAEELAEIVRTTPHTRYPVYEDNLDHIVGMLHVKDIMRLMLRDRSFGPADLRPVPFLPETAKLDTVLEAMGENHTQMAVVMDEFGGTAGIITIEDVFHEIVGEIDETVREEEYQWNEDGSLAVEGALRLDELGELLGRDLEHPEVDTVGGLVLALLERPAGVGDAVEYDGLTLEVTEIAERRITHCVVHPVPGAGEAPGEGSGEQEGPPA
jgi:CBS domain containing-hemolysin-like protein